MTIMDGIYLFIGFGIGYVVFVVVLAFLLFTFSDRDR